ncbi:MAG: hypothetical protein AAB427_08750 [Chloroflexota bacterium]
MTASTIKSLFRRAPLWWWLIASVSVVLTLALAFDLSPWLRGDVDWRLSYKPIFSLDRVLRAALCLLAYIVAAVFAWRWGQSSNRRAWLVVSGAVVLAIPIQMIGMAINSPDPLSVLMFRTTSPFVSGFHDIGITVDNLNEYLHDFPDLVAGYLPHPQRRPPGIILYFAALKHLLSATPPLAKALAASLFRYRCEYWPMLYASDAEFAAAAGGLLTLVFNATSLWPFFAAAQKLIGPRAALAAVLLSPLLPGYVMAAGMWDQAMALITALLIWLLCQALIHRKHWAWLWMGVLISFGAFLTYAVMPLAGFVAFCAGLEVWRERAYWRTHSAQLALNAISFGIGLASLWVVYWLSFRVTFFEMFRATTAPHFAMPTTYLSRLFYNPYDFALFLGYPIGLLALAAALRMARTWFKSGQYSAAQSFTAAGFLMIGLLTVLNISRAEVGRVWVLYMPLVVLAVFADDDNPAQSVGRWATTAGLTAAQLLIMLSVFVGEGIVVYPSAIPAGATPADVRIGEAIRLVGYNLGTHQAQAGDQVLVTLYWQATQPPNGQFVTFVHLYSAQLGLAAQRDGPPREGHYPTRCWQTGEVIADDIMFTVDPNAPPGTYDLIAGMYDPASNNERLLTTGLNAVNSSVVLTQVEVR